MKKNKRGFFLAEETLKIVLAVIVIIFLIYFLASLYFSGKDSEDLKLAEESMNYLNEQMGLKSTEVQIYNPKGWIITAWETGGEMPLQCSNLGWKNCVCFCERHFDYLGFFKNTPLEDCNEDNYCLEYNKEVFIKDNALRIDNSPITLEINYGDKIEVSKK
jgi:uncharacterized protein YneF (UPF0154 family)